MDNFGDNFWGQYWDTILATMSVTILGTVYINSERWIEFSRFSFLFSDTDFSADESGGAKNKRAPKPSTKAFAFAETQEQLEAAEASNDPDFEQDFEEETGNEKPETPSLKLKIKLPGLATPPVQQPLSYSHQRPQTMPHWGQGASPKLPKHTSKLNKSSVSSKRFFVILFLNYNFSECEKILLLVLTLINNIKNILQICVAFPHYGNFLSMIKSRFLMKISQV